ncbi:unnamed protein product [Auanema sp. JU1783]|nr:unnamed protein product [Auanema sp. JU1783]
MQYRGLAFQIGGDKSLDEHITLPNILRKFNPKVFGYSNGIGSANVWEISRLNQGIPGAESGDLPSQARTLVSLMKQHSEVNLHQDWKLVNIFIGANDVCGWCNTNGTGMHSKETFKQNLVNTLNILRDGLPRTIVSLTGMFDMTMLRKIDKGLEFCDELHVFECSCEKNKNFPDSLMRSACQGFMSVEQDIQESGMFDTTDDFTFVVQPFLNLIHEPPRKPDGTIDLTWFAPDCFHFSQLGHANVAKHLWNSIIMPVGFKPPSVNLSDSTIPLYCPSKMCPYFPTTKNTNQQCTKVENPIIN